LKPIVSDATPRARVLLADDHALMRRLLRRAISAHPALEFVGEAADGAEAVALARTLAPDVVVLDLAMPELDGLQVAGMLRSDLPDCAILVFSAFDAARAATAALAAGADRYLEKAAGFEAAAQAAAELAVTRR
jgi:DNA-binding NarL/FixJ family response regulator